MKFAEGCDSCQRNCYVVQGNHNEMTAMPVFRFNCTIEWPGLELGCVTYWIRLVMLPVHKPYISSCIMQLSCRVRLRYSSPAYVNLLERHVPAPLSVRVQISPVFCLAGFLSGCPYWAYCTAWMPHYKSYSCTGRLVTLFLKLPFTSYYRFDSHFYETVRRTLYSRRVQRWRKGRCGRESNKGGIKV